MRGKRAISEEIRAEIHLNVFGLTGDSTYTAKQKNAPKKIFGALNYNMSRKKEDSKKPFPG